MISRPQLLFVGLLILTLIFIRSQSAGELGKSWNSQAKFGISDTRKSTFAKWFPSVHERESVFCVVAVTSPAHLPQRRHWQRAQWSKNIALLHAQHPHLPPKFVFKFCLGNHNRSLEQRLDLQEEHKLHDDLVLLNSPDFDNDFWGDITVHGHSATTLKVLAAIQHALQMYEFQYIVRLGDDSYFRPENFFARVQQGLLPAWSACIGFSAPAPLRYKTSAGEVTAPYPSGMGFILTYDVAAWLIQARDKLLLGGPEDGVVGSWFVGTQIQIYHVPNGFRDLDWSCQSGEDILVHCLREQAHWNMIGPDGNLPC